MRPKNDVQGVRKLRGKPCEPPCKMLRLTKRDETMEVEGMSISQEVERCCCLKLNIEMDRLCRERETNED